MCVTFSKHAYSLLAGEAEQDRLSPSCRVSWLKQCIHACMYGYCCDIAWYSSSWNPTSPAIKDFPINQKMRHAKQIQIHVDAMKTTYKELESLQAEMAVTRQSRLTSYMCACAYVCACMLMHDRPIKIFPFSSGFRMHAGRMHRRTSWSYALPVLSQMLPWTTSSSEQSTLVKSSNTMRWR